MIPFLDPRRPEADARGGDRSVRVNALISGETMEDIWNAAQKAVLAGYRTLKVKVGTRPVRNDIEIIRVLRATFSDVALRADANGAWTLDEARQFAHGVTACELEYIEDPLRDPDTESLMIFRRNCDVPVACDDTAKGTVEIEVLIERKLCDVLVLKPSVIGSFDTLEQLSSKAKAAGMGVVISSLLESSAGLTHVVHCAATYGSAGLAHGLGTAELFVNDTLTQPVVPVHGELAVSDAARLPQLLSRDLASQLDLPN
jgi:o-succinylbenzoate synthase